MPSKNHLRGNLRDKRIIALLESCGVLNTDQLKLLEFPDVKLRICQRKLAKLADRKTLYRDRYSMYEPFYYYLGKRPGQVEHSLAVNWVYTWFNLYHETWEKIHSYHRELDYKMIRPDGLVMLNNIVDKRFDGWFIELDRAESGNKFDKVEKYNTFYTSDSYLNAWWHKLSWRFPGVFVVTTGNKKRIQEKIARDNTENLRWKVYTLEEIKEECSAWQKQRQELLARERQGS